MGSPSAQVQLRFPGTYALGRERPWPIFHLRLESGSGKGQGLAKRWASAAHPAPSQPAARARIPHACPHPSPRPLWGAQGPRCAKRKLPACSCNGSRGPTGSTAPSGTHFEKQVIGGLMFGWWAMANRTKTCCNSCGSSRVDLPVAGVGFGEANLWACEPDYAIGGMVGLASEASLRSSLETSHFAGDRTFESQPFAETRRIDFWSRIAGRFLLPAKSGPRAAR